MGKKRNGKIVICKACSQEFYVPKYRIETAVFCSRKCLNHTQFDKSKHVCSNCKLEFIAAPSRRDKRVFCCFDCRIEFSSKSKKDQKQYRREKIAKLRSEGKVPNHGPNLRKWVLFSKLNECMVCGYKEYKCCLDIHHIDNDPSNNILENLGILCVMCHRKVHRKLIKL